MYGQASASFFNNSGLSITRVASVITEIVLRLLMLLLIRKNEGQTQCCSLNEETGASSLHVNSGRRVLRWQAKRRHYPRA